MKLSQRIMIPVIVLTVLVLSAVGLTSYKLMEREVHDIYSIQIETTLEDLKAEIDQTDEMTELVLGHIDDKNLSLSRALAEIVEQDPERFSTFEEMDRLAKLMDVTEVHLTDENGVLNWGNVESYYGFDFATSDQTKPFMEILDDPSIQIAQEPQPSGTTGNMFQYTGVARTDSKGVVQVGIDAQVVDELRSIMDINTSASLTNIGQSGFVAILEDGMITAHPDASLLEQNVTEEPWFSQVSEGEGMDWIEMDGEQYLTGHTNYDGKTILAMVPATEYYSGLNSIRNISLALIIGAVALMIVVIFFNIRRLILNPVQDIAVVMDDLSHGDLSTSISKNYTGEFNDLKESINFTIGELNNYVQDISSTLASLANDDYDVAIHQEYLGDFAPIKRGMDQIIGRINEVMHNIQSASEQVNAATTQVADGAQHLATGSTQQAATIQEFTAALNVVESQANNNNTLSDQTFTEIERANAYMEESLASMKQMVSAMDTIHTDSQDIAQVIKLIDDIAFQTNILALNAAVEAARAGSHGQGFAVVAEEVRNLASRSAEAARETAVLIDHSVASVEEGNAVAQKTSESIQGASQITTSSAASMREMNDSSASQSRSIHDITQSVAQLSDVVQSNAATAEESSATAEEMSAQANMLSDLVAQFKLKNAAEENTAPIHPAEQHETYSEDGADDSPTQDDKY